MEKLLSGKQDQGDRELGVSPGGLAFVASQGFPEEIWWLRSDTLDCVLQQRGLGVTYYLPIPRNTFLCQEFSFSHPPFMFPYFIFAICVSLHF